MFEFDLDALVGRMLGWVRGVAERVIRPKAAESLETQARLAAWEAAEFIAQKVRKELSVQAPLVGYIGRNGVYKVRAATPATPGAPPRRVTGALQDSIRPTLIDGRPSIIADVRSERGFLYGLYHEIIGFGGYAGAGRHPYYKVVLAKYRSEIEAILTRRSRRSWWRW